jgi:hypothetical protein
MSDYLKTVYFVPRERHVLLQMENTKLAVDLFDGTKTFPRLSAHNTEGLFCCRILVSVLGNGGIRKNCNYFMISHVFKLDFTHIEYRSE